MGMISALARFAQSRGQTRPVALASLAVLAGTLAACTPGAYQIDLFRELHYQPSQRLQEPNRLAPPAGAVPITGESAPITFADATSLTNPNPGTAQDRDRAMRLFTVNCAVCHGPNADGNSAVAQRFNTAGAVPPVDFRSDRVRGRTDGQLYWLITNGVGNMPPFHDLLTDDQRWSLIQIIRNPPQGQ